MQVILLKDVPKVGRKYEVVNVSDGYAANFLLPMRYAEPATPKKIADLESKKAESQAKEDARREHILERLSEITDNPITLSLKADTQGHLYKKVHASDIAIAINDMLDLDLGANAIVLDAPITALGDYTVSVAIPGAKELRVQISIIAEN